MTDKEFNNALYMGYVRKLQRSKFSEIEKVQEEVRDGILCNELKQRFEIMSNKFKEKAGKHL